MTGEIIRQRSANQTHRDRAVRQIVHRTRDAAHLLGIGHRKPALLRARLRPPNTKDTEDTKKTTDTEGRACHSFAPQPLQNFASVSLVVSQDAQSRSPERLALLSFSACSERESFSACSEREPFRRASGACSIRFARSFSICSR